MWPCLLLLVSVIGQGVYAETRTLNPSVDDVTIGTWLQRVGQPEIAVPSMSARQAERLAKFNYLLQPG
jgi:hypothetical protein